ncbi:GNAT family N-acetyltransferase [Chenggangzhangella methanolivorans]|uniref:GNAT family N-acetyltransferase n=1 Tax=Chenggangzhangella methanolivorans TaxID=1437009 RepID=A0A9E6UR04_9HYPH|nr:GNAT family N-acetyltransferase [Chenggangzhangella methanolivorans]QZO01715.1 GNAT family N-acetyltransferase [Chenggangzhangella methanolivorans]
MNILTTARLVLRSPSPHDFQDLHEHVLSDPVVMGRVFSGHALQLMQSREFFEANFDHDQSGKKLGMLVERGTGSLIGFAGLISCSALDQLDYELGFVLRREAWGHGYATEIGLGQLDHGFKTLGLPRILAQVYPSNAASISVITKIGMTLHSRVRSRERGERHVYMKTCNSL